MALALMLSLLLSQAQDPKTEPKQEPKAETKPEAKPEAKPATQEKSPVDVWFEDGLRFKSKDGSFEGRIGGRFLGHYRAVFGRPPENNAAPIRDLPNTFFVRQARLEFEGTLLKDWGFKVQVDFPSGATNQSSNAAASGSSGTLRDGFVEWKHWKELQVRLGQFLMPLSQEDYSSSRFIDFAERSVMNRLNPGREMGIQVAGTVMEGSLDYFVTLSNGQALINDGGRTVIDANDGKELIGSLRYRPFQNSGEDWLKGLRIGLAGSWGVVNTVPSTTFDLISTELSILYADSNNAPAAGPAFDGNRVRVIPQISWPIGPFSLRGEFTYRSDELVGTAPREALRTHGWYLYATCILTGENKTPETRIVPQGDWGAVEVGFRVAQLKIDNGFEAGVFTAPGNTDRVTTFTFGVNWWVTRNVRITVDLIREKFADPVAFDTRSESMLMGMIVRGQIDF